jgi:Phage integrase family
LLPGDARQSLAGYRPPEDAAPPQAETGQCRCHSPAGYFCRSNVAVPSATLAPTVGAVGGAAAVVPAVDELVFTNSHGQPWRRRTFAELVRDARKAAGLPVSVTFHALRHHYASALIAAGCSIKAVQEALGHKNASETLDTYSHLWPADEDRVRDAIEGLHGPSRVTHVSHATDRTL